MKNATVCLSLWTVFLSMPMISGPLKTLAVCSASASSSGLSPTIWSEMLSQGLQCASSSYCPCSVTAVMTRCDILQDVQMVQISFCEGRRINRDLGQYCKLLSIPHESLLWLGCLSCSSKDTMNDTTAILELLLGWVCDCLLPFYQYPSGFCRDPIDELNWNMEIWKRPSPLHHKDSWGWH